MLINSRLLAAVALLLSLEASAVQLITESEASLPPATAAAVNTSRTRGITRGPGIRVLAPEPATVVKSPFNLKVVFEARGGSSVDPSSVRVSYLRAPSVDLLDRIKPGLSAGGIELVAAEAPAGEHDILVSLQDSEGRQSSALIKLRVDK